MESAGLTAPPNLPERPRGFDGLTNGQRRRQSSGFWAVHSNSVIVEDKMQRMSLIALIVSVILAASGQVLLKLGASGRSQIFEFVNFYVLSGLACYLVSVFLWIQILSRAPLYIVYPFTALTLVLVGLASVFVLGERPAAIAVVGWLLVLVGVVFVGLGSLR